MKLVHDLRPFVRLEHQPGDLNWRGSGWPVARLARMVAPIGESQPIPPCLCIPSKEKGRVVGYETVIADPGVEDKRLMVVESEFAQCLRVLDREGNTLSITVRNAWDTGELSTLTKNSPARATGAHVSIIGHITQDEALRYLDRTEAANGFGNRFLWLCARRARVLPEGGKISEKEVNDFAHRLREAIEFGRAAGEMHRDSDARELWIKVYPELSEGRAGLFGSITARAEAQVMRLATLYALLDMSPVIKRVHLVAGLALWAYAEDSAAYVFGSSLGDPMADEILRALRATQGGLTRTDIRDLFGKNRSGDQIGRALGVLLTQRLARFERHGHEGPGRPTEVWFAVEGAGQTSAGFRSWRSYLSYDVPAAEYASTASDGSGGSTTRTTDSTTYWPNDPTASAGISTDAASVGTTKTTETTESRPTAAAPPTAATTETTCTTESAPPASALLESSSADGPGIPTRPCGGCGEVRWWRLKGEPELAGPWVCSRCHPSTAANGTIETIDAAEGAR